MAGAIAGAIGLVVAIAAVVVAFGQLRASKYAAFGQLLHKILDDLYSPRFRAARSMVYDLAGRPLESWSTEEYHAAEEVGRSFNEIGFLLRSGFLVSEELIDWWAGTFVATYQIVKPLIEERRRRENAPSHFIYFEWLARISYKQLGKAPWHQSQELARLRRETQQIETDLRWTNRTGPTSPQPNT